MIQQIDAPLREDVRLLGNLLGETLKLHAGQDLFNQIEQIRALSKGARDGQVEAEKQLEQLFLSSGRCRNPATDPVPYPLFKLCQYCRTISCGTSSPSERV